MSVTKADSAGRYGPIAPAPAPAPRPKLPAAPIRKSTGTESVRANATPAAAVSSGMTTRNGLRPTRSESVPADVDRTAEHRATVSTYSERRQALKPWSAR